MTKVPVVVVWVIAALLLAEFALNHIRPFAVLDLNAGAYFDAARRCHDAMAMGRQVQRNESDHDQLTIRALRQSVSVAMMDCLAKRRLGEYLLANGVNRHDLSEIELNALNASSADFSFVTQLLLEGK